MCAENGLWECGWINESEVLSRRVRSVCDRALGADHRLARHFRAGSSLHVAVILDFVTLSSWRRSPSPCGFVRRLHDRWIAGGARLAVVAVVNMGGDMFDVGLAAELPPCGASSSPLAHVRPGPVLGRSWPRVGVHRPIVNEPPTARGQVRPRIGCLDLALDDVGDRRLDGLPRLVGLLGGPVRERRKEPMRHGGDRVSTAQLAQPFVVEYLAAPGHE